MMDPVAISTPLQMNTRRECQPKTYMHQRTLLSLQCLKLAQVSTCGTLPKRSCRYEDYLDNQITATDMFYLEDVELARHLVELGWVHL